MRTVDEILDNLVAEEGPNVDDDADRGGPTNWGMTLPEFREYFGAGLGLEDLQKATPAQAREFYRNRYVREPGFEKLFTPGNLLALAVDCAVQHGPEDAIEWIQTILGARPDGNIGPATVAAYHAYGNDERLYYELAARNVEYYAELIAHDPELRRARAAGFTRLQARNALGWARRAAAWIRLGPS